MNSSLPSTIDILTRLVSFDSISAKPTHDIVQYICDYLSAHGVEAELSHNKDGSRANVFATIGPLVNGGVVLSGHTDVVPVQGQNWSSDPFVLTRKGTRLYGRGSVDMKGFLACVLGSVPLFQSLELTKPIHIAFSYDEEIGGLGMPVLLESMRKHSFKPSIVIVGEPTEMALITGHKGGYEMRTEVVGYGVHSCNPTLGVNAISVASRLIYKIESIAQRLAAKPLLGSPFDPPYCTFNIGTIEGGLARNATAGRCDFNWEFRPMPGENGDQIIAEITEYALNDLLPAMKSVHSDCSIAIITEAPVPALDDRNASLAAEFVSQITGLNSRDVVSFGTDAGYFSNVGLSTVVFGPGSITRAHKPDEYIETDELEQGLDFLAKLADKLSV
ncbi:MAG: acetylornithine deacetylase [Flavobacteriaceae bacterium]|jgi:acetylornithine deacetylase